MKNLSVDNIAGLLKTAPEIVGKDKYFNSAVLIPLYYKNDQLHVLFEKRANAIRQGGEVSFPGGEFDSEKDGNLEETAIRETMEEIGIEKDRIRLLGKFGTLVAPMGVAVDAFAAYLNVKDMANPDLGTGEPAESWLSLEIRAEGCVSDVDRDKVPDCSDNCPEIQNGEIWGTCTSGIMGKNCYDNEDCGDSGYCSKNQEDLCPPQGNGIGDACDCEGDFDCDNDCDGTDAATFKLDFGRSTFGNPCEDGDPCNGDFGCDGDCDGTDAALFKQDFGRSGFNNPCPVCEVGVWCDYSIPPSTTTTTCLPPETPHCTTSSECCSVCCCTFSGPPYPVCDPFTYPSSGDTVNCTELGGTCI